MQPYVPGVDIETGSTKSVAVNYEGEVISIAQYPRMNAINKYVPDPSWISFQITLKGIMNRVTKSIFNDLYKSLKEPMHQLRNLNH